MKLKERGKAQSRTIRMVGRRLLLLIAFVGYQTCRAVIILAWPTTRALKGRTCDSSAVLKSVPPFLLKGCRKVLTLPKKEVDIVFLHFTLEGCRIGSPF